MKTLVIANIINDKVTSSFYSTLSAVEQLETKCEVLLIGYKINRAAEQIASCIIVSKVMVIDDIMLENILVENISQQLASLIKGYTHVMVAADNFGKSLLPRVAGIIGTSQVSEITKVVSPNVFQRYMYASNVLVEVESFEDIKLLTVRTSNFEKYANYKASEITIEKIKYSNPISSQIKFLNKKIMDKSVDLSNAEIVVSGGRSLVSKQNFNDYIVKLASILHAGVGATRAAVESGLVSNDYQVGQTGKIIAPLIYLAFGLSGAVQHIAGIKNAKMVVAVNIDNTAPIFEYADYGLVADLFKVIPELISKISSSGSQ